MIELVSLKDPQLSEPSLISYCTIDENEKEEKKFLTISKGGVRKIYSSLKMSAQLSKNIFKLSPDIWRDVIKLRSSSSDLEQPFDLSEYKYIVYNGTIIDLTFLDLEDDVERFNIIIDSYANDIINNESGILQFAILLKESEDSESYPILLLDVDYFNGIYKMYSGNMTNNKILITSTPILSASSFDEFIKVNLQYEIGLIQKFFEISPIKFDTEILNTNLISLREVLEILKRSGAEIQVDNESGMVIGISNFLDLNSNALTMFLNEFDVPFNSLKKFSYLRKCLKHDGLTFSSMLNILSEEYFNKSNNVNASVIAYLTDIINKDSDKRVIESEINTSN